MKRRCIMKRSCAALMFIALFSPTLLLAQDEDEAPIAKLKQAKVSTIEPGLPDMAFEQWFQGLAGSNATVHYEVNDCGERAGNADERGKTFPLCVEARAEAGNSLALVLTLTVGTFVAE